MERVHEFCAVRRFGGLPRPLRSAAGAAFAGLRACRRPLDTVRSVSAAGARVRQQCGKSLPRQLAEQLWLAGSRGISPRDYYYLGLFLDRRRQVADAFLYQHEVGPLLLGLGQPDMQLVDDKLRFATHCASAGLPVAPTLAVFRDGRLESPQGWEPPGEDVLVKPVRGSHGRAVTVFRSVANDRFRDGTDRELDRSALVTTLAARSVLAPLLVQPLLRPDAALADLANGALITVRIVTVMTTAGDPVHVLSVLKMPLGARDSDNLGLASPVSEDEGRLGRALSYRLACEGFDHHPDTGAAITGRLVPQWPAARDLALRAHAHFPGFFALGWDVALTREGPLLLEANAGWDTGTVQRPHDRPLGHTRFAALAAARIAAVSA